MRIQLLGLVVLCGLPFLACGSDDEENGGHSGSGGYGNVPVECKAIIDACHEVDGPGAPAELTACHDVGHAEKQAECAAQQTQCVALCEAAHADGGVGGHAGSGGHAGHAGNAGHSGSSGHAGAAGHADGG